MYVYVYICIYIYITPVAGRIFETKNRAIFLERFFGRGISGAALLPYNLFPLLGCGVDSFSPN